MLSSRLTVGIATSTLIASLNLWAASPAQGAAIIDKTCTACHTGSTSTSLSRISNQRKTPEGWQMTISRMKRHGLVLTPDEERHVIKYLSDTQGLAPSEVAPYRYVLDKTPNVVEKEHDPFLTEMCGRCHSMARIGLQRRSADEWKKLIHFHVGQFPTLEIHYLARDRDWFGLASTKVVKQLTNAYPKETSAWENWKKATPLVGEGTYTIMGHTPGEGDFSAILTLTSQADDHYSVKLQGSYLNGKTLEGSGEAILYTGHAYRATLTLNGQSVQQVLHYDPTTKKLEGRMYEPLHPELGSTLSGSKTVQKPHISGISPLALQRGTTSRMMIVGEGLDQGIILPQGVTIQQTITSTPYVTVVDVRVDPAIQTGSKSLSLKGSSNETKVVIYDHIDALHVTPEYAVARVGDGGGLTPKYLAPFEAIGITKINGKKVNIGPVDVTWSLQPYDHQAKEDRDTTFAGTINDKGIFTPGDAGPNPQRKWGTNNAGNLSVVATSKKGPKVIKAKAHLIVTVQKWVNPPIN